MEFEEKISNFRCWLEESNIFFKTDVNLSKFSQIKAGGFVKTMIYPASKDELKAAITKLAAIHLDYQTIGNLSNTIFRDGIILTPFLNLSRMKSVTCDANNLVTAEAGAMMPSFARQVIKFGFGGISGLVGVPGTVGGGIFMNASCYESGISEYLVDVLCVDEKGEEVILLKSDLKYEWRVSAFQTDYSALVIVSAQFSFPKSDPNVESDLVKSISLHRKTYQEKFKPNLGSLFATKDIYSDLSEHFLGFRMLLILVKISCRAFPKTRHEKYARRARALTLFYFRIKPNPNIMFSESTFNCLVNLGGATADKIIEEMEATEKAIRFRVPLENEIVKNIV